MNSESRTMTFWTTTRILNLIGMILFWIGFAYLVGGWKQLWNVMAKRPAFSPAPMDPGRPWWARPMFWLGAVLVGGPLLLDGWRALWYLITSVGIVWRRSLG